MEKRFQIVTDSSCDLPQALADELDLAVLPLHVLIGEHTYANYLDGREIGFKEFYDKLRNGERATTSAVNVSEFTAVMEGKLKEGLDILFIGFSSGLSTTYQSGAIACDELREKYPERKLIAIDSLCASLGEGLLLYLAAKKQQSGASMDEVADYVRETIPHLCHWFTVNDLMFLKRGGRVDAATAIVGTVLQIKPVMHTDDAGTLKNVTKARGRKAALKALAQKLADTAINPAEQTVFICHGDCIEDAEYTAEQIRALTPVKDIIINYVGPRHRCPHRPGRDLRLLCRHAPVSIQKFRGSLNISGSRGFLYWCSCEIQAFPANPAKRFDGKEEETDAWLRLAHIANAIQTSPDFQLLRTHELTLRALQYAPPVMVHKICKQLRFNICGKNALHSKFTGQCEFAGVL